MQTFSHVEPDPLVTTTGAVLFVTFLTLSLYRPR